jgi:thiosulfate/3-mercaptopyruvate sulfurtransferase
MSGSTLVSTSELAANLVKWRVFDCRHDLGKPALGEQQYKEGHIPGALFASLERDLSGKKTGKNGRHPLPEPMEFERWLEKTGLTPKDQVVCYDAGPGSMAARLWWMLRWIGHDKVAVLDGGFAKWTKEGHKVSVEIPIFTPLNYPIKARKDFAVDVATVQKNLQNSLLLDARAPIRYRGEQEPIDPIAGRIPGAKNRFNMDSLTPEGTFKPASALKRAASSTPAPGASGAPIRSARRSAASPVVATAHSRGAVPAVFAAPPTLAIHSVPPRSGILLLVGSA